ncbi:MAG: hypothetical protein JST61_16480, partial [Acidobacteria bacterium]|nr:hypothetical protein [Acidobacteriota bacterium]
MMFDDETIKLHAASAADDHGFDDDDLGHRYEEEEDEEEEVIVSSDDDDEDPFERDENESFGREEVDRAEGAKIFAPPPTPSTPYVPPARESELPVAAPAAAKPAVKKTPAKKAPAKKA